MGKDKRCFSRLKVHVAGMLGVFKGRLFIGPVFHQYADIRSPDITGDLNKIGCMVTGIVDVVRVV